MLKDAGGIPTTATSLGVDAGSASASRTLEYRLTGQLHAEPH
jgi:hypothetical protein